MPSPHITAGIAFAAAGLSSLAIPLLGLGGLEISAAFLAAGLLFGFGGMSVFVIINGARDVRRLIAHLEEARNPADHSRQDESLPE